MNTHGISWILRDLFVVEFLEEDLNIDDVGLVSLFVPDVEPNQRLELFKDVVLLASKRRLN